MVETRPIAQLVPHPLLPELLGTAAPRLVQHHAPHFVDTLVYAITPAGQLLTGYFGWLAAQQAQYAQLSVHVIDLPDEDTVAHHVLHGILSAEDTRMFCDQWIRIQIADHLYAIEQRRAKDRQRATMQRTNAQRGYRVADPLPTAPADSPRGTARGLVAAQVGLTEKTLQHGMRALQVVRFLRARGRDNEADFLAAEWRSHSIDHVYALIQRSGYLDALRTPDQCVRPHQRPQYRFAAWEWGPITPDGQGGALLHADQLATPLVVPDPPAPDTAAGSFILVSPQCDFDDDLLPQPMLAQLVAVMAATPERQFLVRTSRPDQCFRHRDMRPNNVWVGVIVETPEELADATKRLHDTHGVRRALICRLTERAWETSDTAAVERLLGLALDRTCCEWVLCEYAYTGPTRRARMHGPTILRLLAATRAAHLPCFVDPELLVALPWPQDYPAAVASVTNMADSIAGRRGGPNP